MWNIKLIQPTRDNHMRKELLFRKYLQQFFISKIFTAIFYFENINSNGN